MQTLLRTIHYTAMIFLKPYYFSNPSTLDCLFCLVLVLRPETSSANTTATGFFFGTARLS